MNGNEELKAMLDIAIALSSERDFNKLFNIIIARSMEITGCDAGTLYLVNDGKLEFKIMKTLSLGIDRGSDGAGIELPPVEMSRENICAYAAISRETLNIPDVMQNDVFDFSGPKRYDSLTGYHTVSMLVVPLIDSDNTVVGVLQLINCLDGAGNVVSFAESMEKTVYALASLTAIAVSNMRYREELKEQLWSFTQAMATAIDERTPYNASHTRKVAEYCGMIADHINKLNAAGECDDRFDENRREQLVMAAWLHDIGKMTVPLEVMNKETRLNGRENAIKARLEIFKLRAELMTERGEKNKVWLDSVIAQIDAANRTVDKVNGSGFIDDATLTSLKAVLGYEFMGEPFFTEGEKEALSIRKGTLTDGERKIMENHVVTTGKILDKVHFNKAFENTPVWAARHHECLNGEGYPAGLKGDELGLDERILAVSDICDALLATDRPYKKPIPLDKAFEIMRDMASEGRIDGKVVGYLYDCLREQ